MVCSNCGHDNEKNAKFCEKCGSKLTIDAPSRSAKTKNKKPIIIVGIVLVCLLGVFLIYKLNKTDVKEKDSKTKVKESAKESSEESIIDDESSLVIGEAKEVGSNTTNKNDNNTQKENKPNNNSKPNKNTNTNANNTQNNSNTSASNNTNQNNGTNNNSQNNTNNQSEVIYDDGYTRRTRLPSGIIVEEHYRSRDNESKSNNGAAGRVATDEELNDLFEKSKSN